MYGVHCSLADRDPIKNPGSMCNLYGTTLCLKSGTTRHKMFPVSPKKYFISLCIIVYVSGDVVMSERRARTAAPQHRTKSECRETLTGGFENSIPVFTLLIHRSPQ